MTKPTSLVTFLLDRSGSMISIKPATIESFNAYLSGLQAEPDAEIFFTFLQFDSQSLDKIFVAIPVKDAIPLTSSSFLPRGGTPLIDAAVKTIHAVSASLEKRIDKPSVVICIQTDGEENSSREHTLEELNGLITAKTAEGWQFNFMGAGIEAYEQASRMGIMAANTVSYNAHSLAASRAAFAASASNAGSFSARRSTSTEYTSEQRRMSGDKFRPDPVIRPVANPDPGFPTTAPPVAKKSEPLDLTTATHVTSTSPLPKTVKAVVDFSL